MTLYESLVKITVSVLVTLVPYILKKLSKFELFTTFNRLSSDQKEEFFSLIKNNSCGYLDSYTTQEKLQALGINYSPQFLKNLIYYAYKRNIRSENKDLSAFLSMSGPFICSENGEVRLRKWMRLTGFVLFFISLIMIVLSTSMLPGSISSLQLFWEQNHYYLLALQVALLVASIFGLIMSSVIIYVLFYRSIPAFRFARRYRAVWKSRDLFEIGEQNLYCGNNVRK